MSQSTIFIAISCQRFEKSLSMGAQLGTPPEMGGPKREYGLIFWEVPVSKSMNAI